MEPEIKIRPNCNPNHKPITQSELEKELTARINNLSDVTMGKLSKFISLHRRELSIFAIKKPSSWLLFSQCMLQKFKTACAIARLLRKLNHFIRDKDRAQCRDAFNTFIPKDIRRLLAFSIPPSQVDNSTTLEKMRLFLLEDKPPPGMEIWNIRVKYLGKWVSDYHVSLHTLKLAKAKLALLLPQLKSVNLCGYPKDEISKVLWKLKAVQHISCNQMIDSKLDNMTRYEHLTSLDLSGSKDLGDYEMAILENFNLTELNISDCVKVSDEAFSEIEGFKNLKYLNISGCTEITNAGVENFYKLPNLTKLVAYRCDKITLAGLKVLESFLKPECIEIEDRSLPSVYTDQI